MLLSIEGLVFSSSYFLSRRTRETDFLCSGFARDFSHRANEAATINRLCLVFAFCYG
jgi:hypothetical protein